MADPFVRLVEVTKRFDNRTLIDRFSLDVTEGEVIALLGPSGSGKTTVLRLVAGLEKPDSGEVWIAGKRVADSGQNLLPPRTRGIGFVFQDLALWPHLTVEGNLNFVLACAGTNRRSRQQRIDEVLGLVHALAFARSYPAQLSGGEQQRVAIARALAKQPLLVLADEPTGNLDRATARSVLALMRSLNRSSGVTFLVVTHDEEVSGLADRAFHLGEGGAVPDGRTAPARVEGIARSREERDPK